MLTHLTDVVKTGLIGAREIRPWKGATEFRRENGEYVNVAEVFGGGKLVCVTCRMSPTTAMKLDCMSGRITVDGKAVPVHVETCMFKKWMSVSYYADPAVTGTHERVVRHLIDAMLG
jgi:hypothetical protein